MKNGIAVATREMTVKKPMDGICIGDADKGIGFSVVLNGARTGFWVSSGHEGVNDVPAEWIVDALKPVIAKKRRQMKKERQHAQG